MNTLVRLLLIAVMVGCFPANAQQPIKQFADKINRDFNLKPLKPLAPSASTPCDFNLFAALEAATVIQQIQACLAPIAQDVVQPFVTDTQAALNSATTAHDEPAMNCLGPALAILQAAAGTPAQPNATPPVPATVPGPILIFQKYREFVLASGPANCKSWVQTTIAGAAAGL